MAEGSIGEPQVATVEPAAPPPGGWLAEYQRTHCAGGSALHTYQGMLADEIVLPESAAAHADPSHLILACNGWVEALIEKAFFLPGEFAVEALWSYYAHDYITQAKAGGHAQYFAARGHDEIALRCCASALKSMLAGPYFDLFNLMLRLKRANAKTARKIARQEGYRDQAAAMRGLDKRLAALDVEEPLAPRHKTWLKSLRKLKLAPDAEMNQHLNRVASANRLFARRRDEAARIRAQHERDDPTYKAGRALCEMAGLKFAGLHPGAFAPMREVWPEGPDRGAFMLRVDTDRGPRAAMFYSDGRFVKRRLSVLIERGNPLPIGSLSLSRADYEAIVPTSKS